MGARTMPRPAGQPQRRHTGRRHAARLNGFADPIHQQLGTGAVGLKPVRVSPDIARLRAALGDTAFDITYAQAHKDPRRRWRDRARGKRNSAFA
jgi:hypothetical protein